MATDGMLELFSVADLVTRSVYERRRCIMLLVLNSYTDHMPNARSCQRQHLAITHKLGEETKRFTGGSSVDG